LTIPINSCILLCFSCFERLNIEDFLNLDTYSLNSLYFNPISKFQVFYLFCKELRFGDMHSQNSNSKVEILARTISNFSRWSLNLLFVSINKSSRQDVCLNIFHILDKLRHMFWKTSGTRKSWNPWVSVCICILPCTVRIQLYIDFEHEHLVWCGNIKYLSPMLWQR
jgi:hypothetical protein